jgi:hypothetical protein
MALQNRCTHHFARGQTSQQCAARGQTSQQKQLLSRNDSAHVVKAAAGSMGLHQNCYHCHQHLLRHHCHHHHPLAPPLPPLPLPPTSAEPASPCIGNPNHIYIYVYVCMYVCIYMCGLCIYFIDVNIWLPHLT